MSVLLLFLQLHCSACIAPDGELRAPRPRVQTINLNRNVRYFGR